jgi:hypothetical protein
MKQQRRRLAHGLVVLGLGCTLGAASAPALTWTGENAPTTNTLLLYHLNEGAGTNVIDAGSLGRHTTLTRNCYTQEVAGSWLNAGAGIYLAGISGSPGDYVNTVAVTNVNWNKGLTISLWYRVRDEVGSPTNQALFYLANGVTPRAYLSTDVFGAGNNGRLNFTDENGALPNSSTGNADYGTNHVWRHVAVVYDALGSAADGGVWELYLDNVKVGVTATNVQDLSTANNFTIRFMSNLFNTNGSFADFDEILIENAALSDFSGPNGSAGDDGDADDDGIPDAVETAWCGGDCDPQALTPGGNYTYLETYVLDATPSSTNLFRVDAFRHPAGLEILFNATNSRLYAVDYSTNLPGTGGAWMELVAPAAGSNGVYVVGDSGPDACRFYRVRVRVP